MAMERQGAAHRILTSKVQDPAGYEQPTIGGGQFQALPRYDAAPAVSTVPDTTVES